jgi:hypothetical protein
MDAQWFLIDDCMRAAPAQHYSGGCGTAPRQRKRGAGGVQQARFRLDPARHAT